MTMPPATPVAEAAAELALANRILAAHAVVDGFGHVSVRHPADPGLFLISRSRAPALVEPSDIMCVDLRGRTDDPRPAYLERFIHGSLYRERPAVGAIVHSHSPAMVPFSVSDEPLRAVCHLGGFIGVRTPVFDVRSVRGDATDLLVRDAGLGDALASSMSGSDVGLIRGHGSVVVAGSLRHAVFRAVYAEVNAHVQSAAMALGGVTYLTEAECVETDAANAGQAARAWELWARDLDRS